MTRKNWPVGSGSKPRANAVYSDDDSTIESYPPNIITRSDTGDTTIDSCVLVTRSLNVNMSYHPTLGLFDLNKPRTLSVSNHLNRYSNTVVTEFTKSDNSLAPPSLAGDSLFDRSISILENPRRCSSIGHIVSKLNCYRNKTDKKEASYTTLSILSLSDEEEPSARVSTKKITQKKKKAQNQEDHEPSVTTDASHDDRSNEFSPLLRVESYQSNILSDRNTHHRRVRYPQTRSISAPHFNVGVLNNPVRTKNSGRRKSSMAMF
jgi:hypothetical protein